MDTSRRAFFGMAAALASAAGPAGRSGDPGRAPEALTPFADALRAPRVLRPDGTLTVEMRAAQVRLHSQLPPTPMWTYDGSFPGPTIEVRRGRRLRVAWVNAVTGGPIPVTAVQVYAPDGVTPHPSTLPGAGGAVPRHDVAQIPPWLVVHVHGAQTGGGNDGWSENGLEPGAAQIAEYPNRQPAAALWYHDHAMHTSTWTVYAGLLGMYLIRDEEEDALGLPSGRQEIPLILCDRNFETDAEGRLTGRLLHKVGYRDARLRVTRPFEGPYTLVNGTIWPYLDVAPRAYRFRVLNAANSRTFRLALTDDATGAPVTGVLTQIGTDGGLLPAPVAADGGLTLGAAERADLLADFSGLAGRRLRLVDALNAAHPQVMQIRVGASAPPVVFRPPRTLARGFVRTTYENLPRDRAERVVLTKVGGGRHAEMWEMERVDPGSAAPGSEGVVQLKGPDGQVVTYQRRGNGPDDAVGFFAELDRWEHWTLINAADFMHPMHIHLMRFQPLSRDIYDISGFDAAKCYTTKPIAFVRHGVLEPGEQGFKDVVRLGIGEVITLAGRFEATGRFAYHCHLLEHQDEGMMRPLVVFPPAVLALRAAHMRRPGGDPHLHDEH